MLKIFGLKALNTQKTKFLGYFIDSTISSAHFSHTSYSHFPPQFSPNDTCAAYTLYFVQNPYHLNCYFFYCSVERENKFLTFFAKTVVDQMVTQHLRRCDDDITLTSSMTSLLCPSELSSCVGMRAAKQREGSDLISSETPFQNRGSKNYPSESSPVNLTSESPSRTTPQALLFTTTAWAETASSTNEKTVVGLIKFFVNTQDRIKGKCY